MIQKILVTGGEGFVAHHVIDVLLQNTDWEIISVDLNKSNRLDYILDKCDDFNKKRVTRLYYDLTDADVINFLHEKTSKVDYIFHFAALANIDDSIKNPLFYIQTNVNSTLNILEYARKINDLMCFIHISTEAVFGPASIGESHSEYDRYNSINPYAASKAASEEIVISYANS